MNEYKDIVDMPFDEFLEKVVKMEFEENQKLTNCSKSVFETKAK